MARLRIILLSLVVVCGCLFVMSLQRATGPVNNQQVVSTPVLVATDDALNAMRGATATITETSLLSPTDAPSPTIADLVETAIAATPEPGAAMTMEPQTYYLRSETNVRSCPETSCDRVETFPGGMPITVIGVVNGEEVNARNWLWYMVDVRGETAYVYSDRAGLTPPTPRPTSAPVQPQVVSTPVPQQPVQQPAQQWVCSGDIYNCDSFSSRADMASYWNACPGDPSDLDGNDDGEYCES